MSRGIRSSIVEQYPILQGVLEELWPKKCVVEIIKCRNTATLVSIDGAVLFFQIRDGPFLPHLKFLHKYPSMMPTVTADRGAIRFVLAGSDVMDAGMTSTGGSLPESVLEKGTPVALLVEGKEHAIMVGVLEKSTLDIQTINEGKGLINYHYLGDGLWTFK